MKTEHAAPSPLVGLGIMVAIGIVVVGYNYLNAALGLTEIWAGFLFITMWMATGEVEAFSFVRSAVGSLIGVGLALGLVILPQLYGTAGMTVAFALIVVAVYLLVIQRAQIIANFSTMVFLTICAAPQIQAHIELVGVLKATALGIVFFGALLFTQKKVTEMLAARKTGAALAG